MTETISRELRKLIRQRESIKASVDTINKYIGKFDPSVLSIKQVHSRSEKLLQCIDSFNEVQKQIMDLDEGHENENERLMFEDDTCTLKGTMDELISKWTLSENEISLRASQSSGGDSIRLPTIQPPSFNGNLEDWSSFFDTFNALFHNNTALTDVQRLHYLKSSVLGPAADIIKNFAITADNYKVAYNELVRHYENKGFTIQSHIRSLLQSPKVMVASASELRNLHHHVASHVRALKALNQPVQHWDAWLVTLICGQLDASTAGEWQLRQDSKDLPTYEQIESFLAKRIFAFEAGAHNSVAASDKPNRTKGPHTNSKVLLAKAPEGKAFKCPICSASHKIYRCEKFSNMSSADKKKSVLRLRLCFNCLNYGHQVEACRYPACFKCGRFHNSKLHEDRAEPESAASCSNVNQPPNVEENTVLYAQIFKSPQPSSSMNVMLATARVYVNDCNGQPQLCRAVLDSGSQLNLITLACAKKLGFDSSSSNCNIIGVGEMASNSSCLPQTYVSSRFGEHKRSIQLHSLPVIVNSLPSQMIDTHYLNIPKHIERMLADPQFDVPDAVDILIGTEMFFDILGSERWPLTSQSSLLRTDFGWIVVGKLPIVFGQAAHRSLSVTANSSLSLFTSAASQRITEEEKAEEHFVSTVVRDKHGRFVVKLPFAQDPQSLGDSRQMAQKRFFNLERRFEKEPALANEYRAFMAEYLDMDHMELANSRTSGPSYYLPHHAVLKVDSLTTKLRVVFDGSAASKSGISLNDILLKGPKAQPDIFNILLRFRVHRVALTADVEKMYRQIRIATGDCEFQRIVYRADPRELLKEYKLKTVTYGTRSASFLATRCLAQIACEVSDVSIKRVISQDFYVDDLISGGDSIEIVQNIYRQLQSTLEEYGLPLRKWCSSSRQLIELIPQHQSDNNFVINMNDEGTVGTLGLLWQPATDNFLFFVENWCPPLRMTKRSLLSDINKVFDPIGLVSPVLIKGKIFLQQLWALKISWDELLSDDLQSRWKRFYSSLQLLNQVTIPRRVILDDKLNIQLHAFSDASQEAFGACVYIRSTVSDGSCQVRLYTSKSRVAPMKSSTMPRLELCGALLSAELAKEALDELQRLDIIITPNNVHFWSDSTIVIAWIQSKCLFQAYVSNRIARIHDVSAPDQWHHVPTRDNPADLISRGIDAASLSESKLWWHGPPWLEQERSSWPNGTQIPIELPEIRQVKLVLTMSHEPSPWLLKKYSKWSSLIRVTALVRRFVANCKLTCLKQRERRCIGFISIIERAEAERFWLSYAQSYAFNDELSRLKANQLVRRSSPLSTLSPFLDAHGLIRVGGRLFNAYIEYDAKHPVVIPSKNAVTKLIFEYEHRRLLHIGPQALLAHVSRKYWSLRGRAIARQTVHQCVQCFRAKPSFSSPLMAPLPRERVIVGRAFSKTGVDYCGPIMVRSGLRKVSPIKSYICVFVCMATRAVHLELVSSLSTEDFIATLSRFMARRGQCSTLYSDNGTNFVGAYRILQKQFKDYAKDKSVNDYLSSNSIQWQFIPPSAPHFGGLWEAAVKSAKKHMLSVSKGVLLTYDETTTLLCKVEAALNSRPLTPMSSDPADLCVLTPGHFLVGGPLMLPPEPDISTVPQNRLRRFRLMQSQFQTFWKRWSSEYLPQCQRKGKWLKRTRNAVVGDLAILKNELLPPLQWPLVRIVQIHPGQDGVVRAVTVRNSSGQSFKRPVVKLAFLPSEEDEDSISAV